jgi:hypothetical protein
MLTQEDDVEIHALAKRGWNESAIARHTGRDRKTVSKYLAGEGAGQNRQPAASCVEPLRGCLEARFVDDPHVEAAVLFCELKAAGFGRSYPTLVRELRALQLRPVCLVCQHRRGRAPTVEIEHPAGEEIHWDWPQLHETPWGAAGVRADWRGVALQQVSGGVLRADDLRSPRAGRPPDPGRRGRHTEGLAHRPDGDRRCACQQPPDGRCGEHRQALRRPGRGLPTQAGAAQGGR